MLIGRGLCANRRASHSGPARSISYRILRFERRQYIRKGLVSADQSFAEALENKTVTVWDAAEDDRIQYREQAEREGIASILSVPMMLRGEITGVIRVYASEPYHFTPDDTHFVGVADNLGAITLKNAMLYEAVQKDNRELVRDLLKWRAGTYMLN